MEINGQSNKTIRNKQEKSNKGKIKSGISQHIQTKYEAIFKKIMRLLSSSNEQECWKG